MPSLHIAIVAVSDRAQTGSTLPISPAKILRSKTLTPTGTSQTDADLTLGEGEVAICTADVGCWVRFDGSDAGPSPSYNATGGSHWVPAGLPLPVGGDAGQTVRYRTV